ncbi:MAG TPA: hypothetical protein VN397_02560 [Candidatus Methylomirabilis sp.]|nr:hypothetical protein [Candidatus Methylomirabilis sp.]
MRGMNEPRSAVTEHVSPVDFESARAAYDRKIADGRTVALAERRRFVETLRNRCLDFLLNLEELRHVHERVKPGDLELLDRMVHARAVPLDPMRAHDVDVFLRMPMVVSDEAVSIIAMLESLAEYEQLLETEAASPPEQRDRLAQARSQHLKVLKDEWGLN